MSRDARRRFGHSLLGIVMLCAIALGAYALTVGTYDPARNDWTCDDIAAPAGTTCLDINMGSRP